MRAGALARTTTFSSRRRRTTKTRSGSARSGGGRQSDAILSCPCCLEIVTIDCQKHAARDDQWRAMFVRNVRVETSVAFRPASSARSESGKGKGDRGADIRPPDLEESDGPYFRALCDTCGTPVGVRDTDEVYHFFNAFPTNA